MQVLAFTLLFFAGIFHVSCDLYLKRIEDTQEAICEQFDICNIVHNHYFGLNSVEKLCKCPEGSFCSASFAKNDPWSLPVNVRTQMKFCSPIQQLQNQLETCVEGEAAIRVQTIYNVDQVKNVSARILCNCEDGETPNYWKYHSREGKSVVEDEKLFKVIDNFQCAELYKCTEDEFCGFARLDHGFLFQRCTCDTIHDCRYIAESSEVEENIESELFYSGLMYKSRCLRNDTFEHW